MDYLDKGLIDFGLLFTKVDPQKYEALPMPVKDTWGVLMRKDSPLAKKESICPEDLWDKPLIISHQKGDDIFLDHWLRREKSELHIVATYNLLFNASLLVDEGLGYALGLDNIINTQSGSLCFRAALSPVGSKQLYRMEKISGIFQSSQSFSAVSPGYDSAY